MALIPTGRYPSQVDDADPDYPHGKARNSGSYQDGTGTPLEKDWINDDWGFKQALLADGLVTPSGDPDTAAASQYLDALRVVATRASFAERALRLREIVAGTAITDAQNVMAAARGRTRGHATIAIKHGTNNVSRVWDWGARDPAGSVASITSQVCGAARFPGPFAGFRILAIGTGGNRCSYSDDEGTTWAAGANLGATPRDIVANATHARFMATFASGVNVAYSADGVAAWASESTGLASAQGGIAVLANGDAVACGRDGDDFIAFALSADGGETWGPTGATLPDFGEYEGTPSEPGCVCGQARGKIFHVGRALGRTRIRICSSSDGVAWELNREFLSPSGDIGLFYASNPRIQMCEETGLLLVTSTLDNGCAVAFASPDLGATWSDARVYALSGEIPATAWAVAAGRVFATVGTRLYASDGIARP